MLFLSDISRQENDKHTTSQQEFDATVSRKGHGRNRFTDNRHTTETSPPDVSDKISDCFPEYAEAPTNKSRTAQSARIFNLQIEMEQLDFLAEFTKRARCEVTRRTTPTDDV